MKTTITVWGTREEIEPLLDGIGSVLRTGTDTIDNGQPVVEIQFDNEVVNVSRIFQAVSKPEQNELGGIANGICERRRA